MKDIEKAILEEKAYLIEGEEKGSLLDRILACGFDSLTEYFEKKKDYYLKNINFKIYMDEPTPGIDKRVWAAIEAGEACVWIPKLEKVLACVGYDEFDYELAKELDVGVLNMPHSGGTIITGPDDLTIGIHFKLEHDITYNYFFDRMRNFMISKGLESDGNDFMYNGKKVMGCSLNQTVKGMSTFFFSCTFTDHLELINKLCNKERNKMPGYIPSGVLTRQELLDEVLSWLQK